MSMASLMQIRLVIVSIQTSKSLDLVLDHGYGVGSASWNVRLPRALRVTLATMKTTTWWSPEPCGGRWSVARVARGAAALAKCRGYNCRHRAHWTPRRRSAWPRCCHCRDLHCSWRCETSVPSNDSDSKQPSMLRHALAAAARIKRACSRTIVSHPSTEALTNVLCSAPTCSSVQISVTSVEERQQPAIERMKREPLCVWRMCVCAWERAASKMNVE